MDLVGKKIGNFEVLEKIGTGSNSRSKFLCRCHCGNERIYNGRNVMATQRKSCGCLRTKKVEDIGPARVYNHYKQASKTRKIEFTICKDEFYELVQKKCFYCKKPPYSELSMNKCNTVPLRKYKYNGIDRIDNSKGYITGNCVTCCKRCNQMKNDMDLEEWLNQMREIIKNFEK